MNQRYIYLLGHYLQHELQGQKQMNISFDK